MKLTCEECGKPGGTLLYDVQGRLVYQFCNWRINNKMPVEKIPNRSDRRLTKASKRTLRQQRIKARREYEAETAKETHID